MAVRTWSYPFREAQELAGDELLAAGDELGLRWRGSFAKPELVPAGKGRRAIVVRVELDADERPRSAVLALFEDGRQAGDVAAATA